MSQPEDESVIDRLLFQSGCLEHTLCNAVIEGHIVSDRKLIKLIDLVISECVSVYLETGQSSDEYLESLRKHFEI